MMRPLLRLAALLLTLLFTLLLPAAVLAKDGAKGGDRQAFVMRDFKVEAGAVLPRATIIYATWGTLNAARDNAVLLPSHYMADASGYNWLIGPGKALDPAKYFLVATEMFGNGKSTSPSNSLEPFDGPRFPVTTIRDNVEATRRLLQDALGVQHLAAVIGFSMGGQQAFQWAVSHPDFMDRIVVTAATAKTWPHGIVRLESQIIAIQTDPAFKGGDYVDPPKKGLEAFGAIWAGWLFSQAWWREELWKPGYPAGTDFKAVFEGFHKDFIPGGDANDIILQMRSWERHDVGTMPGHGGDVKQALASIKVPVLYMPSETDLYFPVDDARYEAQFIPRVTFMPIPSKWGHTAGAASNPADARFLNEQIGAFMRARR